jgi:2-C-methyl-D-erythritol 4-phosphate cytidylyltransferase
LAEVDTTQVVVHDAARPLAGSDLVKDVLAALDDAVAVVPLVPIDETVKNKTDEMVSTVDRSNLFLSQTPQAFNTEALKAAHLEAELHELEVTDDAELIELYGGKVASVSGHRRNIKVTFPEDFELAERLLQP